MNEHPLAGAEPSKLAKGVVRRHKRDRQGRGFFERQCGGFRRSQPGIGDGVAAETIAGDGNGLVALALSVYALADAHDLAGAFDTEGTHALRVSGARTQRREHVDEIEADGSHLDLDFTGCRIAARRRFEPH